METITDEAAYNDAMNQYNYENAVYDKTIQDINAKTSIIQQQDQQLELRLKQLDTERNAMVSEIEAVQKVVKDNVDKSFKTFSG
jgi:predicted RNase H-like nuclease (RuvC/YqgF family)